MELALEFWSLPFQFLSNALANLLVFVAKCFGVSWDPLGPAWISVGPFWDPLGPLGIRGSIPRMKSMDQNHGSDPWIWSMDLIHGSDPWIRWNVTESTNVGQNRLPYLAYDWKLSYIPLGYGNVLRALLLSVIGSHLTPCLNLANVAPAQSVGWRCLFGCYFRPESL